MANVIIKFLWETNSFQNAFRQGLGLNNAAIKQDITQLNALATKSLSSLLGANIRLANPATVLKDAGEAARGSGILFKNLSADFDTLNNTVRVSSDVFTRFYKQNAEGAFVFEDVFGGKLRTATGNLGQITGALETYNQAFEKLTLGPGPRGGTRYRNALGQFASAKEIKAYTSSVEAAARQVATAWNAVPPMPANIETMLRTSPQVIQQLQRQGLGGYATTPEEFQRALIAQGAKFNAPTKDLVRGTTLFTGEFGEVDKKTKQLTGSMINVRSETDKYGHSVTRTGGALRGLSQFTSQTIRDFQKVIEWTVATSVVFGGLAAVVKTFQGITALDKLLTQFAITAQMTTGEAKGFFVDLAKVADNTATPIEELVKAADDFALATRKMGQSAEESKAQILAMANAVGILTNLSGLDTVKATDVLTSSMKQLGLTAEDLISVLNKITAVAGGQSGAIADITEGLGTMAEAGKQAGLNIDQQVATIQVLSQVTSKSASEVAVSFKNLVGSVDSRAGVKALKEFGIAVRDEQGNFRNFLDIYRDISDAIDKGVIPEGRVKEVIKAIAGGPRRAPDAAALLANINQIFTVEERSVSATNEALVANSRILDTTAAKMVVLSNKFKELAFEKFGAAFKDAFGTVAVVLGNFLDFLNRIPSGTYGALAQLGLLALAFKVIVSTSRFAVGALASLVTGYGLVGTAALRSAAAAETFNAAIASSGTLAGIAAPPMGAVGIGGVASTGLLASLASRLGRLGKVGAIGAVAAGAGAAVASSNILGDVGSTAAQLGGMIALMAPGPIKLFGAALLGTGFLMQALGQKTEDTTQSLVDNEQALYTALQRNKEAAGTLETLSKEQADLNETINNLSKQDKTPEILNSLSQAYNDLFQSLTDATEAQKQFNESQKEIASLVPQISESLQLHLKYGTPEERAQALKTISQEILSVTNPQAATGTLTPRVVSGPNIPTFGTRKFYTADQLQVGGSAIGQALLSRTLSVDYNQQTIDIKKLGTSYGDIFKLIDQNSGKFADVVKKGISREELGYIEDAVTKINAAITEFSPEQINLVNKAFEDLATSTDQVSYTLAYIAQQKAKLVAEQAWNMLPQEEIDRLGASLDLLGELTAKTDATTFSTNRYVQAIIQAIKQQQLLSVFTTGTHGPKGAEFTGIKTLEQFKKIYEEAFPDEAAALRETFGKAIPDSFIIKLANIHGLLLDIGEAAKAASGWTDEMQASIEKLKTEQLNVLANAAEDIFKQVASGDISKAAGDKLTQKITELSKTASNFFNYIDANDLPVDGMPGIQAFIDQISSMPRFANLAESSFTEAISTMVTYAIQNQATSGTINSLTQFLLKLQVVLDYLNTHATEIKIVTKFSSVFENVPLLGPILKQMEKALDPFEILKKDFTNITNLFNNPKNFTGLTGAGGGGGANDIVPGILDIPKELIDSTTKPLNAFLEQAIANAKALQTSIPGEDKRNKDAIVELLNGTKKVLEVRGVKEEYLRRALEELADIEKKRLDQETKADTIRRIRVGNGTFAAIANVPMNAATGVSVGGPEGPITVNLGIAGQVLTPAQLDQLANKIAAILKAKIAAG